MGKESTSVGPSPPRKRPLRSVMASSSTKISDTSASAGARSSASTRRARRSQRGRSTSTVDCSSEAKTAISRASVARPLVRVHDVLHDLVPHDVVAVELDEREIGDADEDVAHREQPTAAAPLGQVDLGDVAGDDDLGTEPEPGEEHLHLLGGRVLRLVEDDERVVERAAAH